MRYATLTLILLVSFLGATSLIVGELALYVAIHRRIPPEKKARIVLADNPEDEGPQRVSDTDLLRVSDTDLLQAYVNNEADGDRRFLDSELEVNTSSFADGPPYKRVVGIRSGTKTMYCLRFPKSNLGSVEFRFRESERDKLAGYSAGPYDSPILIVRGRCIGLSSNDTVVVDDAVLVKVINRPHLNRPKGK